MENNSSTKIDPRSTWTTAKVIKRYSGHCEIG